MKTDVILVNWNTGAYLKECVESLLHEETHNIGKIIIVDNNSSDESINILPKSVRIKKELA